MAAPVRDFFVEDARMRQIQFSAAALEVQKKAVQISRHPQCFADFRRTIDMCLVELGTTHRPKIDRLMTLIFQTFGNVSMLGK